MDTSVPVVVLKGVADHYAHGRLAAVRTLGRLGIRVVAVHESRWSPAALSRFAAGRHAWTLPGVDDEGALDELLLLGRELQGRPVLVTTDDVGTLWVEEHAATLREVFRFPEQPAGVAVRLANKGELHALCRQHGIPTPDVAFPGHRDELRGFSATARFPVVVKYMDPRLLRQRSGATSVAIAESPEELLAIWERADRPEGSNLMIQEYVPGGPEATWMFNGYFGAGSARLAGFTGRKLRAHPPRTGAASLAVCEPNDEVERLSVSLLQAVGYRGIVDMGLRHDPRDDMYKVFDVNPRLGATFRLFVGAGGLDVLRAMYLDLTGQVVPEDQAPPGRCWWVEPADVWTFVEEHRAGRLPAREWVRSLRAINEPAWWAADDPLPFVSMVALSAARPILRRARGRVPGR